MRPPGNCGCWEKSELLLGKSVATAKYRKVARFDRGGSTRGCLDHYSRLFYFSPGGEVQLSVQYDMTIRQRASKQPYA
ncbi:unnamed protein product [Ascophyllum nodosum]